MTGNVLVFYDPSRSLPEIVELLERILTDPPKPPKPAPAPPRPWGFFEFVRALFRKPQPPQLTPGAARPRRPLDGRAPERMPQEWHTADPVEVARFWAVHAQSGLSANDAARRLDRYGANILRPIPPRSALSIFGAQFANLPVILLAGSAALSIATGGLADAIVIVAVIAINAGIGFTTEYTADRTIQSLLEISEPEARVLRDGEIRMLPAGDLVPGDLILLARGEVVPADARLLTAKRLTADEAALTGESLPAEKDARAILPPETPLAERANMVYRGTLVTGGQAVAVVIATGRHTEIGRIQSLIAEASQPETPLQRQMSRLGTQMTWGVCAISAGMFAVGLLRGFSMPEMLRSAVSLAIAAIPEGLPTVATVCLANGMRSLLREQVLARRLAAIEALGGVEALCFDKTGTLTWNRMTAVAVFAGMRRLDVSGGAFLAGARALAAADDPEIAKLLDVCALCSEAGVDLEAGEWRIEGTPTEAALVRLAMDGGVDVAALRRRLPAVLVEQRTETQPYMTTVHQSADGRKLIAVKGSPGDVLALCDWDAKGGKARPLTGRARERILGANRAMAGSGLRVLGAACLETENGNSGDRLVWLGLVGLADPPREGLRDLMKRFQRAGIRPLMLTGDQAATAEAVAQTLDLNGAAVYSRVTPSRKLEIVRDLQRDGAAVAMTGDGVNDAPALKAADVGIAMGRNGAKVARGVADLLLLDDNIASLLPAIREGRAVRENLRKAVHYIAATNASEIMVMFASIAGGLGSPFNPRQLLWINLITDIFPELALALERPDPGILARPPRPASEPLLDRADYARLGRQSAAMTASAMGAYLFGLARYGPGAQAGTLAFLTLTSAQLLHGVTARSERRGAVLPPNPAMNYGLLAGFGLLLASQFVPGLTAVLGASRIGAMDALVCAGASLASLLANETMKVTAQEEVIPEHAHPERVH